MVINIIIMMIMSYASSLKVGYKITSESEVHVYIFWAIRDCHIFLKINFFLIILLNHPLPPFLHPPLLVM